MNISKIFEKEKEYDFYKLISETNVNGIIEKDYKKYKIKAYIDYQTYETNVSEYTDIDDRETLLGLVRIPTVAVDTVNASSILIIENGDYLVFKNKKYEVIEVREKEASMKRYYVFYLIDFVEDVKFDVYKTELNTLFFNIFKGLDIEAVVNHSLFQNSYFDKIEKPFLTYKITQINQMNDYTTSRIKEVKDEMLNYKFRSKRIYKMLINLYDKDKILNLDAILSKNKILKYVIENLEYKMENVSELEVKKLELISEDETIINNRLRNEKVYNLEFTVDTFYTTENEDYIEDIILKANLKNGGKYE